MFVILFECQLARYMILFQKDKEDKTFDEFAVFSEKI